MQLNTWHYFDPQHEPDVEPELPESLVEPRENELEPAKTRIVAAMVRRIKALKAFIIFFICETNKKREGGRPFLPPSLRASSSSLLMTGIQSSNTR